MTDEQILAMAKQVTWRYPSPQNESLIAFARLIEASVREECAAKLQAWDYTVAYMTPHNCAAAIREGK